MKKIDFSLVAEVTGVVLTTIGIGMLSLPIALIVLGTFLVWITEKAN
jgi:amino acid permease